MALINCPQCGKEVSDKASTCPGCGYVLTKKEPNLVSTNVCKECNEVFPIDAGICPNCGCPIEKMDEISKTETDNVSIAKKSKKKYIIISIVAVLLIIAGIVGFFVIRSIKEQKVSDDYAKNLEIATNTMMSGSSNAKESDPDTDKYTKNDENVFYKDFNDSLSALFSDSIFMSKINSIQDNQETVSSLMKQLQDPPEEFEEAYTAIKNFYDAYIELTELSINANGSYNTFSSDFTNFDSKILKYYKAMDMYIGE